MALTRDTYSTYKRAWNRAAAARAERAHPTNTPGSLLLQEEWNARQKVRSLEYLLAHLPSDPAFDTFRAD